MQGSGLIVTARLYDGKHLIRLVAIHNDAYDLDRNVELWKCFRFQNAKVVNATKTCLLNTFEIQFSRQLVINCVSDVWIQEVNPYIILPTQEVKKLNAGKYADMLCIVTGIAEVEVTTMETANGNGFKKKRNVTIADKSGSMVLWGKDALDFKPPMRPRPVI